MIEEKKNQHSCVCAELSKQENTARLIHTKHTHTHTT